MHLPSMVHVGLILSAAVLMVLAACGPASIPELGRGPVEVSVSAEDNGDQVNLTAGQTLVLTLEANPSTGYTWEVLEVKDSVLQLQGEPEFQAVSDQEPAPPGAGGVQILRFDAVGTGETPLRLIYHRSWEKDVEPAETFSIQVVVR